MTQSTRYGLSVDTRGAQRILDALDQDIEKAVRPAAQAGAQVLYDKVHSLLNELNINEYTGLLKKAIYQVYSKRNSGDRRATYEVSYNKQTAPHGHLVEFGYIRKYEVYFKNGKWYTKVKPEKLKEYLAKTGGGRFPLKEREIPDFFEPRKGGPVQVAPKPFMRRAADSLPEAQMAMTAELVKRVVRHEP